VLVSLDQPMSKRTRVSKPVLASFLIVSFAGMSALLAIGIWGLLTVQQKQAMVQPIPGGMVTAGRIIDVQRPCDIGCSDHPVIEYADFTGRLHEFNGPETGDRLTIGSAVRVSYDPRSPGDAHDISVNPSRWDLRLGLMISLIAISSLAIAGLAWLYWLSWGRPLLSATAGSRT
jgi:Protein of unknown function (DUF3592)